MLRQKSPLTGAARREPLGFVFAAEHHEHCREDGAGQSAQPTAEPKRRGLPRAGFAATEITRAERAAKGSLRRYAPLDPSTFRRKFV
jgi:hypothetical protein